MCYRAFCNADGVPQPLERCDARRELRCCVKPYYAAPRPYHFVKLTSIPSCVTGMPACCILRPENADEDLRARLQEVGYIYDAQANRFV